MNQNKIAMTDANTKKIIATCGVTSLIMGGLGVMNMVNNTYGLAAVTCAMGAVVALVGLGGCIFREEEQRER